MLQNIFADMQGVETRLREIVPGGYALTINIRHLTPEFFVSTYPSDWVMIYTERRYALFDPVTVWCRFNEGIKRWSDIDIGVLRGVGNHVMTHAAQFGLVYGGAVSLSNKSNPAVKSLISGGRADREMTDEELTELAEILDRIVEAVGQHAGLSVPELETLRDLATGMTHDDIADRHGISPATVKKRIERVRKVLGARNAVHAVAIAARRGLILTDPTF